MKHQPLISNSYFGFKNMTKSYQVRTNRRIHLLKFFGWSNCDIFNYYMNLKMTSGKELIKLINES